MQQQIHECTWDEKTGRPQTKLDSKLDDVLQTRDDLNYADISMIEKTTRPSDTIISNTFIPALDTNIVSTFGTVKDTAKTAIACR